ncbi:unnamed protein product [Rotaria sp. Silwood2]|nr:unnamed protein product [Rotaria sp. Silwood2]
MNNNQRRNLPQRSLKEKSLYSCIVYIDEPMKYSIVESKRLVHVNDDGYGIIKELGKSYNIRVEQTGTQSSMERYGQLLELAMQQQMHEEVPSDCEDWKSKKEKQNRMKNSTTASTSKSMLSTREQRQPDEGDKSTVNDVDTRTYLSPSTFQSDAFDTKLVRSSNFSTQRDDRGSPSSNEVEEEQQLSSSSDEDDLDDLESSNFLSLQTTPAASKKRAKKPITKLSVAKRLRFSANDSSCENQEDQKLDFQKLLNHVKELNATVMKIQKEQSQMTIALERQNSVLQDLCKNQKKLAKSFNRHQIPVVLENDDENSLNLNNDLSMNSPIVYYKMNKHAGPKQIRQIAKQWNINDFDIFMDLINWFFNQQLEDVHREQRRFLAFRMGA